MKLVLHSLVVRKGQSRPQGSKGEQASQALSSDHPCDVYQRQSSQHSSRQPSSPSVVLKSCLIKGMHLVVPTSISGYGVSPPTSPEHGPCAQLHRAQTSVGSTARSVFTLLMGSLPKPFQLNLENISGRWHGKAEWGFLKLWLHTMCCKGLQFPFNSISCQLEQFCLMVLDTHAAVFMYPKT